MVREMNGGGSVQEATGNQGQMSSALSSGLDVIDLNQVVTFTQYRRMVLPIDGFVFWCRADILSSSSALLNTSLLNSFTPNRAFTTRVNLFPALTDSDDNVLTDSNGNPLTALTPPGPPLPTGGLAPTLTAMGSLHHTTVNRQEHDESFSVNRMVFTSKDPINDLNEIAPDVMYLATVDGNRYAFSSRSMWYKQAALYHYSGDAVYPALASQIIDNPDQLDQTHAVVSNSLPIWLRLNQLFPIYPSLLVPDNLRPPYAVAHIGEDATHALGAGAWFDSTFTRWQLVRDTVHITTYGVRNDTIMDWLDLVQQYALDHPDTVGVMNSPVPRDAKRGQVETGTIAQKKLITFEVDYYQTRMRSLARQLILEAFITEVFLPTIVNSPNPPQE